MRRGRGIRLGVLAGVVALAAIASAQPLDPTVPPSGDPWGGSGGVSGSAGSAGSGGGSAAGSAGSGSASTVNPGSGSGSATADPGTGSGSGSGSGSASPTIIQIPTDANAPDVSAAASPTTVTLGKKFTLFVTATFNAGVTVNLREPLELGPAFEVTRRVSEDKPAGDGRTTREWQVEVIAWEIGDVAVPPVAVTFTAFGKAGQVATNPVKIKVTGLLGDLVDDPKAMRADAPPEELLTRDWFWLYVAIGAAVGLVMLISVVMWLRARRRRRSVYVGVGGAAATRKFDSASERALHKLREIENSGVLERDADRKDGYASMVETIREYIASRYRVVSQDQTSAELLRKLERVAPADEHAMIGDWLERCDIVKYGGLRASVEQANATLSKARDLIVATTSEPAAAKSSRSLEASGDREAA